MHVVIVGCGYVGLEFGRRLSDRDHEVIGVRRSADGIDAVAEAGLDPVEVDATDPASLASLPDADVSCSRPARGSRCRRGPTGVRRRAPERRRRVRGALDDN